MNDTLADQQVDDFMTRWADAVVSNDTARTDEFVTPDWILIDRPGMIDRDRFNEAVASGSLRHTEMTHDIQHIRRVAPGVVVVLTHGQNSGSYEGQPIDADEWTLDVIVQTPIGWRCSLTQLTPRAPWEH